MRSKLNNLEQQQHSIKEAAAAAGRFSDKGR